MSTGIEWDDEKALGIYSYPMKPIQDEVRNLSVRGRMIQLGPFLVDPSPESHLGPFKHAIDFLVPIGTQVLAAASGVVIEVVEQHNQGGPSKEFARFMNYVTVQHPNGEFSQYCHLAQNSVSQKGIFVGRRVYIGQPLGTVGLTGWTDTPHLHFLVFRSYEPRVTDEMIESFKKVTPGCHYLPMDARDVVKQMLPHFKSLKVNFER